MIIYNVTIQLTWNIHTAWLQWLQQEHIPEIMNTGCFEKYQLVKLLEVDEADGPTYAVQYYAQSKALYNQYLTRHAALLRQKSFEKWGNQFIALRSVMEVVH